MRYLLDTQVLLWTLFQPNKLKKVVSSTILDVNNEIYVSAISFWEISLKYSLGKLELNGVEPCRLPGYVTSSGIGIAELDAEVLAGFNKLPRLDGHKDPFDRMIIWQAVSLNYVLVSRDGDFAGYKKFGLKLFAA